MKVAKFGGSSVANVSQIQKVGDIIKSDSNRKFIVVSAPGKRDSDDTKVTDLLLNLGHATINNEPVDKYVDDIINRFTEIIDGLQISTQILDDIKDTLNETMNSNEPPELKMESFKAIGEDSSAKIVSAYLNSI